MKPQPCIVLTRRRTGAQGVFKLLGNYLPGANLGTQPFIWTRPLGEVSRAFHENHPDKARRLLDEHLAQGVYFRHQYETESREFNIMLFDALREAGYRVVLVERRSEVDRLYSLMVATHFQAWDKETIARLRENLRSGTKTSSVLDWDDWQKVVDAEQATLKWFRDEYPKHGVLTEEVIYEDFFRDGVGVLDHADRIFAFVGLGARSALLSDSSLLDFTLGGEHYALGLRQYSSQLSDLYRSLENCGIENYS